MASRHRTKYGPYKSERLGTRTHYSGPFGQYYTAPQDIAECWDATHYGWQDPAISSGGNFFLKKRHFEIGKIAVDLASGSRVTYAGDMLVHPPVLELPQLIKDGTDFGAEAYKKMKPAKPKVESLNFIYELKDLPRLLRNQWLDFSSKGISNSWLAYQFGWKPMLSDIRKMVQFQRYYQKYLKQLIRDEGRVVRRRTILQEDETTSSTTFSSYSFVKPNLPSRMQTSKPVITDTTTVSDRIWANAHFQYWLPPGPRDIVWTTQMLGRIYGLHVRPDVVYNAVPWSWLVDWFTGFGDVLENMSSGVAESHVADNFYIMREVNTTVTRTASVNLRFRLGGVRPVTMTSKATSNTKSRIRGNPFGLNIGADLDARQISILGALARQKAK